MYIDSTRTNKFQTTNNNNETLNVLNQNSGEKFYTKKIQKVPSMKRLKEEDDNIQRFEEFLNTHLKTPAHTDDTKQIYEIINPQLEKIKKKEEEVNSTLIEAKKFYIQHQKIKENVDNELKVVHDKKEKLKEVYNSLYTFKEMLINKERELDEKEEKLIEIENKINEEKSSLEEEKKIIEQSLQEQEQNFKDKDNQVKLSKELNQKRESELKRRENNIIEREDKLLKAEDDFRKRIKDLEEKQRQLDEDKLNFQQEIDKFNDINNDTTYNKISNHRMNNNSNNINTNNNTNTNNYNYSNNNHYNNNNYNESNLRHNSNSRTKSHNRNNSNSSGKTYSLTNNGPMVKNQDNYRRNNNTQNSRNNLTYFNNNYQNNPANRSAQYQYTNELNFSNSTRDNPNNNLISKFYNTESTIQEEPNNNINMRSKNRRMMDMNMSTECTNTYDKYDKYQNKERFPYSERLKDSNYENCNTYENYSSKIRIEEGQGGEGIYTFKEDNGEYEDKKAMLDYLDQQIRLKENTLKDLNNKCRMKQEEMENQTIELNRRIDTVNHKEKEINLLKLDLEKKLSEIEDKLNETRKITVEMNNTEPNN